MSGQCTQQAQFRTRVVSAHSRHSSGHRWSVRTTTETVQDTHGKQLADPQRQLPGHSAADSLQGHAATDSVHGPSAVAPRATQQQTGCKGAQ
ncbi:unnamed protein product [Staurois parvus]|uniref:Uncharacterized protein n=1 Tax=Staurois parvus TaxID=386267 RepID=A0ABN9EYU7_9NEOB|nr:unnamed protein product [Staurois parvus]